MTEKTIREILSNYLAKIPSLDDSERRLLAAEIPVRDVPKGSILLRAGEAPRSCYFVLRGCVRKYAIDEEGTETSVDFFTEEQAVLIFQSQAEGRPSEFFLSCLEDSLLMVGDLKALPSTFARHPKLAAITREMMEGDFVRTQESFAAFKAMSPEERYRRLIDARPELLGRIPHYMLASYIGVTPESMSRIRKRIS
jgi:CRP-like cAMP-binding protein